MTKKKGEKDSTINQPMSRRTFLKLSGFMGASGAAALGFLRFTPESQAQKQPSTTDPNEGDTDVNIIRSSCLMCHSGCGIQCKVKDDILIKIDGNPYDNRTLDPHLAYATDPAVADVNPGTVCAKGAAGIRELYNPYRIKSPLKRAGPRGSGKWESITWDKALTEIVEGGTVMGHTFMGLAELRDTTTDIGVNESTYLDVGQELEGENLGKIANQVVYSVGRSEHGRKEFTDRFWKGGYGTQNKRLDHTSICETSHHVGYELSTYSKLPNVSGGKSKGHLKPDIMGAEYIIWFGTSPIEANFPFQSLAKKLMNSTSLKKWVVVDPRFSNSAAKADQWVPIKMGADAAFALGMIKYLLEGISTRCDTTFLKRAEPAGGAASPSEAWCDASYLVYTTGPDTGKYAEDGSSNLLVYDLTSAGIVPQNQASIDPALLDANGYTYNTETVKTVIQLLKERADEKTYDEYATICGLDKSVITGAAKDFCGETGYDMHKCCADHYRGIVQHTNGTYNSRSVIVLNFLVGNPNEVGGMNAGGSHWHETGGKTGNPYDLGVQPGKVSPSGPVLSRAKNTYPGIVPATRPWFPLAYHGNWQEIVPSIKDGYPYKTKVLINHMGNTLYSTPAGTAFTDTLKDETALPLLISFTTVMGETDALSDYILPDMHYLERYSTTHTAPAILSTISQTRVPVVSPLYPGPMEAGNWSTKGTCLVEDVMIELATRIASSSKLADNTGVYTGSDSKKWLPGFGPEGLSATEIISGAADTGFVNAYDWYKKCFANIAFEGGTVPADSAEQDAAVTALLDKGGRFEDHGARHSMKYCCLLYSEKMVNTVDSMTGLPYDGLPKYEALMDVMDNPIDDTGYDFVLNTYKKNQHTQSRTAVNDWLMMLEKENHIEMNAQDAATLLIGNGDMVRLTSPTNQVGVVGKVKLVQDRPGVVSIAHSFGHWDYGAKKHQIDGTLTESAKFIAAGVSGNPIQRLDPVLMDICLQDKIGGSCSFYDTKVKIERV